MAQQIIDKDTLNRFPADAKEQNLNGLHWEVTDWSVGDPITEEKMDNTEQGLIIAFYKLNAILRELDGIIGEDATEAIQLNSSRLDALLDEVGGTIDNNNNIVDSRIDNLWNDLYGSGSNSRLDTVIQKAAALATELYGSDTTTGNSRLDLIENMIAALANELGGGRPDGTSTTYPPTATRLDDLEAEIGGTRAQGSGYSGSRLDLTDNKIKAIAAELGGTEPDGSSTIYGGTTRLDRIESAIWGEGADSKIGTLVNEVYGVNDGAIPVSGASRLDGIDGAITGLNAGLTTLGNKVGTVDFSNSDLEYLRSITDLTNAVSYLAQVINTMEGSGSAIDYSVIIQEVWGSSSTEGSSRIDALENRPSTIPLYVTTNGGRTDALTIAETPKDQTIFFIAINNGTNGSAALTLGGNNVYKDYINQATIKYKEGSLVALYRNGNRYYIFNAPLAL